MSAPARRARALPHAHAHDLAHIPHGCRDDGGATTTDGATTSDTTTTTSASTATASSTSETGTTDTATTDLSTSTSETTDATTGPGGPPDYPPPQGDGTCPDGAAPVDLGGVVFCAPFCAGEGEPCPQEALSGATGECSPFFQGGGSGQPCGGGEACPAGEACQGVACAAVAFWGCLVRCGPGGACPEPMSCAPSTYCAYP